MARHRALTPAVPRGFTFTELLIVVAVVSMLVSFVLPGFQSGVRRAHRDEARLALLQCAQNLEKRIAQIGTYGGARIGSGGADAVCAADSAERHYRLAFAPGHDENPATNRDSYVLVARPVGSQEGDACGTFTLDQDGKRGVEGAAAGYSPQKCW